MFEFRSVSDRDHPEIRIARSACDLEMAAADGFTLPQARAVHGDFTSLPRRMARIRRIPPAIVQTANANTDDSRPKLPPVRISGPLMLDRIKPADGAFPETIPEKIADWV